MKLLFVLVLVLLFAFVYSQERCGALPSCREGEVCCELAPGVKRCCLGKVCCGYSCCRDGHECCDFGGTQVCLSTCPPKKPAFFK